jgi:hypothetical protein
MENEYLTPKCSNYKCYNETGINLKRKLPYKFCFECRKEQRTLYRIKKSLEKQN